MKPKYFLVATAFVLLTMLCFSFAAEQSVNGQLKTKSDFERKIDSLRQIIPTVTGNQIFSFKELSQRVWAWQTSQKFIEIDSATWLNNFNKPTEFGTYGYSGSGRYIYKTNYYYKEFDFKDNLFNLIILQYVNDDRSFMHLVQFDKQGNRKKTLRLACIEKSPDGSGEEYSIIQGNKITTYYDYNDNDDDYDKIDTTEVLW
jgi:hypothetical protein